MQDNESMTEQIERDASDLISQFGAGAYEEARKRARQQQLGQSNRSPGHWEAVCRAVARRTGRIIEPVRQLRRS
jgi:hypothetical protein